MAQQTLTPVNAVRAGVTFEATAADAAGSKFLNTGKEALLVYNGDSVQMTVTIVTQATDDGLAIADRTVDVPATTYKLIGPFQRSVYNDATGYCVVTYSSVTSLTEIVLKVIAETS